MTDFNIQQIEGGVLFSVKVVPGSSRTAIAGVTAGELRIKISAAPEKGKANKSLGEWLAKRLSVSKKNVKIVSGLRSPHKKIEVLGVSSGEVAEKLGTEGEK